MAESVTKYHIVPNGNVLSDFRGHFSLFRTRKRSSVLLYGLVIVFVVFTVFVAFTPSSSSSAWFVNIFTLNSTSPPTFSDESYRSHFPSVFSYFFPNSSDISQSSPLRSQNVATSPLPSLQNTMENQISPDKGKDFEPICKDQTCSGQKLSNQSVVSPQISQVNASRSQNDAGSQVPTSQNSTKSLISPDEGKSFEQSCRNETCNGSKQSNETTITPPISQIHNSRSQNIIDSQVPISINSLSNSKNLTKPQVPQEEGENSKQSCKTETCGGEEQSKENSITPQISRAPQSTPGLGNSTKGGNGIEDKGVKEKVPASDFAASLSKKGNAFQGNDSVSGQLKEQGNLVASLVDCDLYDGVWLRDDSYPLYKPGSCSLIDEQFNCFRNGRPDNDYHKLKWKPKGCTLPRLNGDRMLKFLKGKRLVFVGDSLNRNMWESLVCILRNSVKNKKKVYEAFGRHYFRTEASYSFVFKDYNFTVEFFVAPFLVQQWEVNEKNGETKETLRLDLIVGDNDQFKNADFLVFNTGHWWTHDKTSKGEDYYQEGSHVYKQLDVVEAFRRAITTWARWVDANINPSKTHVLFRGYSASHFSGGQWNSGGQCDSETQPIRNDTYLTPYPWKMKVFESVIKGMKTPVSYLNVTRMTDHRKDGHPSIYRKQHITSEDERRSPLKYQDCSHWCLPGVPDLWNELLYAELLRKRYKDQQQQNNKS